MDCQRRLLYVASLCGATCNYIDKVPAWVHICKEHDRKWWPSKSKKKKNLNFSFVVPSWYYAINRCCAGDYIAVYILCAFKSPHSQPKGVNAGIHSTIDSCAVLVSSYPSGAIRHHQGTTGRGITPAPYQVHQNKYKKDDGNSEW
jgi:hypothetical protein